MTSYGESTILVSSSTTGSIRVLGIYPDPAVFPRLGITLGVTLHERPGDERAAELTRTAYEMRDATGELRLSEHGGVLGSVFWAGPRRHIRSSVYGSENQLRFVCDLDFYRLEQIERRRAGGVATFWLQLWPSLLNGARYLDAEVGPIHFRVPRDEWLSFYSAVGGGHFDIIEIQYSTAEAEQFKRALARIQEARVKIGEGDYDGAVGICRNAIEALRRELVSAEEPDPLKALLLARTDEPRTTEYLGIVSRLKQLSGFVHHEFGRHVTFSRAEAQFILRTTEALLAFVGRLTST